MVPSCLAGLCLFGMQAPNSYVEETRMWREQAETRLKADDGWLTVAGLYWLKDGPNRAGAADPNEIVIPGTAVPPYIGTFHLASGTVRFVPDPRCVVKLGNQRLHRAVTLAADVEGKPDVLTVGDLSLFVIKRGGRYGIRLRDKNSRMRREFTGRMWFPIDERYRVVAAWQPYEPPKMLSVPNVLGETEQQPCPGAAVFTLNGIELRLEPVLEEGRLFFIFKDRTAGRRTYPAGRFLYSDVGQEKTVVLDFNRAYNPPCAFTPYATCPLPPKQNQLPVPVEAGELNYHHHQ